MFKIKSNCVLLKSNVMKGKYLNRELHYLVNRSTDVGRGNAAVPFSFVDSVLHMNHNAIYSSGLRSLLTLFRLGFFGQSVTGEGGAPRTPPLYLWNQ